jgi:hypothetical protein
LQKITKDSDHSIDPWYFTKTVQTRVTLGTVKDLPIFFLGTIFYPEFFDENPESDIKVVE